MSKHGEVSWKDSDFDSGEKNGKDTFLRLSPGSNTLRLVTNPHLYYQHKHKIPGEKGFGHRINCSKDNGSCVVCAKSDIPKRRWLIGVIERKTNTYKILDIGWSVFKNIKTFAQDDDWGDPSNYDIDIVVNPNGGATNYYTCVCKPKKALSASDLKLRDENSIDELARRTKPPSPEKVEEKFQKLYADASVSVTSDQPTVASTKSDSTDDDSDFADYDKTVTAPF